MNFPCSIAFFKYKPKFQQFEFREKKKNTKASAVSLPPNFSSLLLALTQGQLKGSLESRCCEEN